MSARQALIVKIHVGKKQLQLTDDEYRDTIRRACGYDSCRDLSIGQLELVAGELKRMGFIEPVAHSRREKAPRHVRHIYALWHELRDLGALSDSSKKALRSFVKRQTQSLKPGGFDAPEFLSADDARPVAEALKSWIARAKEARHAAALPH
ncbi:regulatory protein GemA [Microvirga terricola]|uniref:Regulatory protein GemA n=1 Tax=Microvirga terricola TaxID=2719797 RepID=A0ABX0VAI2_9HYPH|nr:regulatory protein GemA [Microvirga terricola]NIX75406.1 regulatory protein GemA [Microvirga terricola]